MKAKIAIGLLTLFAGSALAQQCPIGSYRTIDNYGNSVCKTFDGDIGSVKGSLKNCPVGTYRSIDSLGNQVCKALDNSRDLYDTSKGCPIGFYQGIDKYGNAACVKL